MIFLKILLHLVHLLISITIYCKSIIDKYVQCLKDINDKCAINKLMQELKKIEKRPTHIAFSLNEKEMSYVDLANLVIWCVAMGTTYISIYDRLGHIKNNETSLVKCIEKKTSTLKCSKEVQYDFQIYSSLNKMSRRSIQKNGCKHVKVFIQLLSIEDGRQSLVNTACELSKLVKDNELLVQDIVPDYVDVYIKEKSHYPDPELLLIFGNVKSLMGFSPWELRLTEILFVPSHHNLHPITFLENMNSYTSKEQRFGK